MFWYTTPLRSIETIAENGFEPLPAGDLAPKLMVILGREPGKTYPIPLGENELGRDADCAINLADPSVSRRHARIIRRDDGSVVLLDGGSTNGTYLNERRVSSSHLNNGDILRVGNVLLKYYEPGTIEAEVFQRVFQMALTDPMTETLTKSAIMYHLERMVAARPTALAVIIADLDHFKQVNDTYGHVAGDVVLKHVAATLKTAGVRPGDLVGRFGGEEFLIVLPETSLEQALEVAEAARRAIEALVIPQKGQEITLTSSFGVTAWKADDDYEAEPAQTLLERADEALYQAKREGRNRVCAKS